MIMMMIAIPFLKGENEMTIRTPSFLEAMPEQQPQFFYFDTISFSKITSSLFVCILNNARKRWHLMMQSGTSTVQMQNVCYLFASPKQISNVRVKNNLLCELFLSVLHVGVFMPKSIMANSHATLVKNHMLLLVARMHCAHYYKLTFNCRCLSCIFCLILS
jgi:hypothetical protein